MKFANHHAETSARIYYVALIEACIKAKVTDVRRALTDADEFPRLKKISEVEFAIGWLHGCAESHGVTVEFLWDELAQTPKKRRRVPKIDMKTDMDGNARRADHSGHGGSCGLAECTTAHERDRARSAGSVVPGHGFVPNGSKTGRIVPGKGWVPG